MMLQWWALLLWAFYPAAAAPAQDTELAGVAFRGHQIEVRGTGEVVGRRTASEDAGGGKLMRRSVNGNMASLVAADGAAAPDESSAEVGQTDHPEDEEKHPEEEKDETETGEKDNATSETAANGTGPSTTTEEPKLMGQGDPTSFFFAHNGSACPPGAWMVEDEDICKQATKRLGLDTWGKTVRKEDQPGGCYKDNEGTVNFNYELHGANLLGSNANFPNDTSMRICKTSFFMTESTNECPEGAAWLSEKSLCQQAMHALRRGPWDDSIAGEAGRDDRPGGCAMNEGGKFYFNPSKGASKTHTSKVCMTRFFRKMSRNECPDGTASVKREDVCKEAMSALRLGPWMGAASHDDKPGGCFHDDRGRVFLNDKEGDLKYHNGKICMTISNQSFSLAGPAAMLVGQVVISTEQAGLMAKSKGAGHAVQEALVKITGVADTAVIVHLSISSEQADSVNADYTIRVNGSAEQLWVHRILSTTSTDAAFEAIKKRLDRHGAKLVVDSVLSVSVPYVRTPDPAKYWCGNGVSSSRDDAGHRVCCAMSCEVCGHAGCEDRAGGEDSCCVKKIRSKARSCSTMDDVVCLMPTATPAPTWEPLPGGDQPVECHAHYADLLACCGSKKKVPDLNDGHHCPPELPRCVGYVEKGAYGVCQEDTGAPTILPTSTPTPAPTPLVTKAPDPLFYEEKPDRTKRPTPKPTSSVRPPPPGKKEYYFLVTPRRSSARGGKNVTKVCIRNDVNYTIDFGWRDYDGGHDEDVPIKPGELRFISTNTEHTWAVSIHHGMEIAHLRFKAYSAGKQIPVSWIVEAGKNQCGHQVKVSGVETSLPASMGTFDRMEPDPGANAKGDLGDNLAGRPIYQNPRTRLFLYYWAATTSWGIDKTFDHTPSGMRSKKSGDARCPNSAHGWSEPPGIKTKAALEFQTDSTKGLCVSDKGAATKGVQLDQQNRDLTNDGMVATCLQACLATKGFTACELIAKSPTAGKNGCYVHTDEDVDHADGTEGGEGAQYKCYLKLEDPRIKVREVCHERVILKGAKVGKAFMGWYNSTNITTSSKHGNRQIYKNNHGMYLYYWDYLHQWKAGPTFEHPEAQIRSTGDEEADCPDRATGWEAWKGNNWTDFPPIHVRTGAHSRAHKKLMAKREEEDISNKEELGKRIKAHVAKLASDAAAKSKPKGHAIRVCKAETGKSCVLATDCVGAVETCDEGECVCQPGLCFEGGGCKKDPVAAAGLDETQVFVSSQEDYDGDGIPVEADPPLAISDVAARLGSWVVGSLAR